MEGNIVTTDTASSEEVIKKLRNALSRSAMYIENDEINKKTISEENKSLKRKLKIVCALSFICNSILALCLAYSIFIFNQ